MSADSVHPVDIVHHQASGQLDIGWSDGLQASISSHALRGACRCAACVKLRRDGLGPTRLEGPLEQRRDRFDRQAAAAQQAAGSDDA